MGDLVADDFSLFHENFRIRPGAPDLPSVVVGRRRTGAKVVGRSPPVGSKAVSRGDVLPHDGRQFRCDAGHDGCIPSIRNGAVGQGWPARFGRAGWGPGLGRLLRPYRQARSGKGERSVNRCRMIACWVGGPGPFMRSHGQAPWEGAGHSPISWTGPLQGAVDGA